MSNLLEIVGIDGTSEAHISLPHPTLAERLATARLDRLRELLPPADKAAIERAAQKNARKAAKRLGVG